MLYNIVLVSAIHQHESVTGIHMSPLPSLSPSATVGGHLGCFHVLSIVNSAVMNIGVHVSIMVFSGYMPSGGIAGLYGSFILSF